MRALLFVLLAACSSPTEALAGKVTTEADVPAPAPPLKKGQAEAIFASGCFWCAESDFEKLKGVTEVVSGYAGGHLDKPTYKAVGLGVTGHTEAIRVVYDPKKISYADLLEHFWTHVDYTDAGGQFCDRGSQYRPAIFPVDDAQRELAAYSKGQVEALVGGEVAVQLEEPGTFWVAEGYHQDFYKTNPEHYHRYRNGCGRDARVATVAAKLEGLDVPEAPPAM